MLYWLAGATAVPVRGRALLVHARCHSYDFRQYRHDSACTVHTTGPFWAKEKRTPGLMLTRESKWALLFRPERCLKRLLPVYEAHRTLFFGGLNIAYINSTSTATKTVMCHRCRLAIGRLAEPPAAGPPAAVQLPRGIVSCSLLATGACWTISLRLN